MKKLFIFLFCLVASVAMTANNVSEEEAASIALKFLSQQQRAGGPRRAALTEKSLRAVATPTASKALYAFNVGESDGFVLVSGSDLGPQVLGYADKGSFSTETMPANMKSWLDSYAEQIAYIERTMGRNQQPIIRKVAAAIAPLLQSTWGQGSPYNNLCPVYNGKRTVTGCVATALAQVINYYKYPSATTAEMPAYTTTTHGIDMPALPVTAIDWDNMRNSYSSTSTAAQKQAVATLMQLCGQAVSMDYTTDASGASTSTDVSALKKYFGYDESVEQLVRRDFTLNQWENIIYNELASGRPVIYAGQSVGGGHSFVVDGYDGSGLFHINWGWEGVDDGYFELSVLNPYNNTSIGTSSTDDGFSFNQRAIVGIQHGTGEKTDELPSLSGITVNGEKTFTRSSASDNFTGISITTRLFNMTGDTHTCVLALYLCKADGTNVGVVYFNGGDNYYQAYNIDDNYGGNIPYDDIVLGAGLDDGDYIIYPVGWTDDSDGLYTLRSAKTYNVKATISGNTLTLSEPVVALSGSVTATGSRQVKTTVPLRWQIKNAGTYFSDDVFLTVDGKVVGGRMLQVAEGGTVNFDIDFMPTTAGTKQLALCHYTGQDEYEPFATGSVAIESGATGTPQLTGSITITNANSDGNVTGTTAELLINVKNVGDGTLEESTLEVDLYQQQSDGSFTLISGRTGTFTLEAGKETAFKASFDQLETGNTYAFKLWYTQADTWIGIDESVLVFKAVDETAKTPVLTGKLVLTNADSDGNLEDTTAQMTATVTNTGTGDLDNKAVIVALYKLNEANNTYEYLDNRGLYATVAVGESYSFKTEFTELEPGGHYIARIEYSLVAGSWPAAEGSTIQFDVIDPTPTDDISQLANAIYAEPSKGRKGGEGTLRISLKNEQQTNAYSFDLTLPEGVSLVSDGSDDYEYELSSRHNGHTATVNYQQQKGVYSFAVLSLQSKVLSGNDGTILTLPLKIADDVAAGDYKVTVSNAKYSLTSGATTVRMANTTGVLTVEDYTLGDVNDDGDTDVADAVCIVNHVVGKDTPVFVEQAADVNRDGDVDVADAVRIINLVVGKISTLAPAKAPARSAQGGNALYVDNFTLTQDDEGTLDVNFRFDADNTYTAYSFNIELPEGLEFLMDEGTDIAVTPGSCHDGSHSVTANLSEGLAKVAALSLKSKPLKGTSGTLLSFKVRATEKFDAGKEFRCKLKDVLIVPVEGTKQRLDDTDFTVTIAVASGIAEVKGASEPFDVYTVTGVKVRNAATSLDGLPKGIYVVNGRKVTLAK